MTHSPNMFVGVGTGRCGTLSLARILDGVEGVSVKHEGYHITRAKAHNGIYPIDAQRMLARFSHGSTRLEGHVGALWTGFVPVLRLQFPVLPVICMHRSRDAVVESFMAVQTARDLPWSINIGGYTPTVDRDYLAGHWDWCESVMSRIKSPVIHLDVSDLNDDNKLAEVYDFLHIDEARRVYPEKRVWHQGTNSLDGRGGEYAA